MFKVTFSVVPPGGGEQDYDFEITLPALPGVGDYLRVTASDECLTHDFIVRRRWFIATQPTEGAVAPIPEFTLQLQVFWFLAVGNSPLSGVAERVGTLHTLAPKLC